MYCVDKERVIAWLKMMCKTSLYPSAETLYAHAATYVDSLPTYFLDRPIKSEWIFDKEINHYLCPTCGMAERYPTDYCPQCGKKLRGEVND